jgi:hypothetical protein
MGATVLTAEATSARPALDVVHTLEAQASRAVPQPLSTPQQPAVMLTGTSGTGWVFALAILAAARLGRLAAQEARMDSSKLQVRPAPCACVPTLSRPCASPWRASNVRAYAAAAAQYDRSRRRALSAELLQRRQEWEQQEAERAASTDAKRCAAAA